MFDKSAAFEEISEGMMIAVIDYDAGNMMSVVKAFQFLGQDVKVTRDRQALAAADKVVLPGVGAFGDAMARLERYDLAEPVRQAVSGGKPFLGICLGLQLLFESSEEAPGVEGLGILPGTILRIPEEGGLKIPHMGWNNIQVREGSRILTGLGDKPYVYFVHSYYLQAADRTDVAATAEYGVKIDAAVERENVFACQFHPEKSGEAGLKILRNFAAL